MTANNMVYATNSLRSSVKSIKKKVSALKISIQALDAEIEDIEMKFDNVVTQSEIFKARVEREMGREVRRLEKELEALQKSTTLNTIENPTASTADLKVASTVAVLECVLRAICVNADDFRLLSYAFLFPTVIERVVKGDEEAYFLEEMPASADVVIRRGLEYLTWIRQECNTHLTDPQAWETYSPMVSDWWRNDALPLLYGSRDDNWDIDEPLSNVEMTSWKDNVADRPLQFPGIYDCYEIYKRHKDEVYKSSGVQDFEMKTFSHEAN
jgi:hypothetical protein